MSVNYKKTKVIPFNFSRKYDFEPRVEYDGQILDIEYTAKLLGVIIDSSGRWNKHIEYITNKAKQRVYFLKRIKHLGAFEDTLKINFGVCGSIMGNQTEDKINSPSSYSRRI